MDKASFEGSLNPEYWRIGMNVSLFKDKEERLTCENYRDSIFPCENYRGSILVKVVGKIRARVIVGRMRRVTEVLADMSKCGR